MNSPFGSLSLTLRRDPPAAPASVRMGGISLERFQTLSEIVAGPKRLRAAGTKF